MATPNFLTYGKGDLRYSQKVGVYPAKNTLVACGDSITAQQCDNGLAPQQYTYNGYVNQANWISGNPFIVQAFCGGSSQTSTQILARIGTGLGQANLVGGASTVAGGANYAVNDQITLASGIVVRVTSLSGSAVNGFTTVSAPVLTMPQAIALSGLTDTQVSTTGSGSGFQGLFQYPGDPLYFNPGVVVLEMGANDFGASILPATTTANIRQAVARIRSAGAVVILATIPPSTYCESTTGGNTTLQGYLQYTNQWIREECAATQGLYLFDFHRAVVDPAVGCYQGRGSSSLPVASQDGVHPNYQGGNLAGQALAQIFALFGGCDTSAADAQDINYLFNAIGAGANASGTNNYRASGTTPPVGNGPNAWSIGNRGLATSIVTVAASQPTSIAPFVDNFTEVAITGGIAAFTGTFFVLGGDSVAGTGRWDTTWAASTPYTVGDRRNPAGTSANGAIGPLVAQCVTSGTSGSSEPTWGTNPNAQVTDGTATWAMIPRPGPWFWSASKFYGLGTIIKPTAASTYYLKCTTAGQAGSTEPTWNSTVGSTNTDGSVVWTTIAFVPYSYYAEAAIQNSGLTASKGAGVLFTLSGFDNTGTAFPAVSGSFLDISGTSGAGSRSVPSGRMRTPVLTLPNNKIVRYLDISLGAYTDASANINLFISRPSIRSITSFAL